MPLTGEEVLSDEYSAGVPVPHWQIRAAAVLRFLAWIAVILGLTVFVVRMVRVSMEGAHSLDWCVELFAPPLGSISMGILWLKGAASLRRARSLRGALFVGAGTAAMLSLLSVRHVTRTWAEIDAIATTSPVRFKIPRTGVSVLLAREPVQDREEVDTVLGSSLFETYEVRSGLVHYGVCFFEYPEASKEAFAGNQRGLLDRALDNAIKRREDELILVQRSIELGAWPGYEHHVEMLSHQGRNEPIMAIRRFYFDGQRLLLFAVLILKSDYISDSPAFDELAARFFDSIQVEADSKEK